VWPALLLHQPRGALCSHGSEINPPGSGAARAETNARRRWGSRGTHPRRRRHSLGGLDFGQRRLPPCPFSTLRTATQHVALGGQMPAPALALRCGRVAMRTDKQTTRMQVCVRTPAAADDAVTAADCHSGPRACLAASAPCATLVAAGSVAGLKSPSASAEELGVTRGTRT
jgi:hypothetical protein